jgi:hypothetical protein
MAMSGAKLLMYCQDLQIELGVAEKERDEAIANYENASKDCAAFIRLQWDAEQQRDEAIAWGEKLKGLLASIIGGDVGRSVIWKLYDGQGTETEDGKAWLAAQAAISTPAPAALSYLRQQVRREALEEAAKACESQPTGTVYQNAASCAAAIRRLAEEQEGKNES